MDVLASDRAEFSTFRVQLAMFNRHYCDHIVDIGRFSRVREPATDTAALVADVVDDVPAVISAWQASAMLNPQHTPNGYTSPWKSRNFTARKESMDFQKWLSRLAHYTLTLTEAQPLNALRMETRSGRSTRWWLQEMGDPSADCDSEDEVTDYEDLVDERNYTEARTVRMYAHRRAVYKGVQKLFVFYTRNPVEALCRGWCFNPNNPIPKTAECTIYSYEEHPPAVLATKLELHVGTDQESDEILIRYKRTLELYDVAVLLYLIRILFVQLQLQIDDYCGNRLGSDDFIKMFRYFMFLGVAPRLRSLIQCVVNKAEARQNELKIQDSLERIQHADESQLGSDVFASSIHPGALQRVMTSVVDRGSLMLGVLPGALLSGSSEMVKDTIQWTRISAAPIWFFWGVPFREPGWTEHVENIGKLLDDTPRILPINTRPGEPPKPDVVMRRRLVLLGNGWCAIVFRDLSDRPSDPDITLHVTNFTRYKTLNVLSVTVCCPMASPVKTSDDSTDRPSDQVLSCLPLTFVGKDKWIIRLVLNEISFDAATRDVLTDAYTDYKEVASEMLVARADILTGLVGPAALHGETGLLPAQCMITEDHKEILYDSLFAKAFRETNAARNLSLPFTQKTSFIVSTSALRHSDAALDDDYYCTNQPAAFPVWSADYRKSVFEDERLVRSDNVLLLFSNNSTKTSAEARCASTQCITNIRARGRFKAPPFPVELREMYVIADDQTSSRELASVVKHDSPEEAKRRLEELDLLFSAGRGEIGESVAHNYPTQDEADPVDIHVLPTDYQLRSIRKISVLGAPGALPNGMGACLLAEIREARVKNRRARSDVAKTFINKVKKTLFRAKKLILNEAFNSTLPITDQRRVEWSGSASSTSVERPSVPTDVQPASVVEESSQPVLAQSRARANWTSGNRRGPRHKRNFSYTTRSNRSERLDQMTYRSRQEMEQNPILRARNSWYLPGNDDVSWREGAWQPRRGLPRRDFSPVKAVRRVALPREPTFHPAPSDWVPTLQPSGSERTPTLFAKARPAFRQLTNTGQDVRITDNVQQAPLPPRAHEDEPNYGWATPNDVASYGRTWRMGPDGVETLSATEGPQQPEPLTEVAEDLSIDMSYGRRQPPIIGPRPRGRSPVSGSYYNLGVAEVEAFFEPPASPARSRTPVVERPSVQTAASSDRPSATAAQNALPFEQRQWSNPDDHWDIDTGEPMSYERLRQGRFS